MKITIISAVWQRPHVFRLFAEGLHKLIDAHSTEVTFRVIIAGSEGEKSQKMVTDEGFDYVEAPNDQLAKKFNATTRMAKGDNPDFVLLLGSDDIISADTFQIYLDKIKEQPKIDFIGLTDFYFYDLNTGKAAYWGGYADHRKGAVCGAGVLVSRNLMRLWGWAPWSPKHNHILDDSINIKRKRTPHKDYTFSLKEHGVVSVDLKSNTNMTPFELWPNTNFIDSQIITDEFSFIGQQ